MNVCYDKKIAVLYFCIDDEPLFDSGLNGGPAVSEQCHEQ